MRGWTGLITGVGGGISAAGVTRTESVVTPPAAWVTVTMQAARRVAMNFGVIFGSFGRISRVIGCLWGRPHARVFTSGIPCNDPFLVGWQDQYFGTAVLA